VAVVALPLLEEVEEEEVDADIKTSSLKLLLSLLYDVNCRMAAFLSLKINQFKENINKKKA
jgi:hypothetical protein